MQRPQSIRAITAVTKTPIGLIWKRVDKRPEAPLTALKKLVAPKIVAQIKAPAGPISMAARATGTVTRETLKKGVRRVPKGVRPMIRVSAINMAVSVMKRIFDDVWACLDERTADSIIKLLSSFISSQLTRRKELCSA